MTVRHILLLLTMLTAPTPASALIVDVDAKWEYWKYNYSPIPFSPGTYQITPVGNADGGTFDAWNAWGSGAVSDCDASGLCSRGYLNSYSLGYVGAFDFVYEIATVGGSVVAGTAQAYATPTLALNHAKPYIFSLAEPRQLYF